MRVEDQPATTEPATTPRRGPSGRALALGIVLGVVACGLIGAAIGGPAILAKRGDLPLERVYGDFAVSMASRIGGGNQQNPVANDRRALAAGRDAYTGSCAVCHGANGDGRGVLGTSSYPNATDLRSSDAVEKSDGQLFWIIKNGLNFTGMPGFADQYSDQDIWSMVTFVRALQDPNQAPAQQGPGGGGAQPGPSRPAAQGPAGAQGGGGGVAAARGRGQSGPNAAQVGPGRGGEGNGNGDGGGDRGFPGGQALSAAANVPAPTPDQLDRADPLSPDPAARGAALYFAQGCQLCHGAIGDAPANLSLPPGGGPEATRAIRQGRPGMPQYSTALLNDAELRDLQAYLATIGSAQRRGD